MLKVLTIEQSNEWDEIVTSFSDYDVYYLSGYVKAFRIHGDGEPLLFFYEGNGCKAINVVMRRDIASDSRFENAIKPNTFFDFTTPYGYGGWLISGKQTQNLFDEYERWCVEHNIISEFVRFHPVLKNHTYSESFYSVIPLGETVAIDTLNRESIWTNFSPKNRNVIRKAINNGIEIKNGFSKELFDTFRRIYNGTMDKDNADPYYYFEEEFYESIRTDLKDNATIFYAELKGIVVAASLMIFANGRLNYHLSGSLREYQNLAPSNLMLWKASEWGNETGCTTFHLGGGVGSCEDNLFKFKKAFYRGELCRYHIGKKIYKNDIYNHLVSLSGVNDDSHFFPKYRG